jgi:signal transduction histidine kinase
VRLAPFIAGILAFCWVQAASAGAPGGQFTHARWTSKDGVPSMVQALAQTPDGYIWLGTYDGLYRFDGLRFEKIDPAPGHPAGSIPVSALLVTRSGDLWVGYTGGAGMETRRNGRFVRVALPDPPDAVTRIVEGPDGAIWVVGGPERRALRRLWRGTWERIDTRFGVPDDEAVSSVFPARDGTVWLATERRVLFLRPGGARFVDSGQRIGNGASLAQDATGAIWISDPRGTWKLSDRARIFYPAQGPVLRTNILFDGSGNLWGSTYTGGVFRIAAPNRPDIARVERYRRDDGLSSNQAMALLRDREDNIWIATELGLDKLSRASIERVAMPDGGATSGYVMAADDRGTVYIASGTVLYAAQPGSEPEPVLTGSATQALCRGGDGIVWVARSGQVLRLAGGRITRTLRLPDTMPVAACTEAADGTLWLTRAEGGLIAWNGNEWRNVHPRSGPFGARDTIVDWNGRPVATIGREAVLLLDGGGPRMLTQAQLGVSGLTAVQGTTGGLLVAGGLGLVRWDGHRMQRLGTASFPWLRGIRGIAQTRGGDTWMITNGGIIRIATAHLEQALATPRSALPHDLFDEQDGFSSRAQNAAGRQIVEGGDGRLWFLTRQGVLRIDPTALVRNALPPPVAIQALTADGRRHADPSGITLPAGTRNLSIDFTGLSMTVPSRVRFRYLLEGVDAAWVDPGTRRQAFYTNLSPGDYRFRVIAANNDGVWNREGAVLAFTIRPTFVQTPLFAALCAIAVLAVLWALYRLRLRTLTRRMSRSMAERLDERERIARELHDTLLQGVQALILRFQLAADDIPPDRPMRRTLEEALDKADQTLAEGRDRVQSLRVADTGDNLERSVRELVRRQGFAPSTKVHLETRGTPRPLDPLVCDDVMRIASEALFNIWRHADAGRIEIEIIFAPSAFTICFRDNGVGIPAEIVRAGGRENHFGLVGMRERAAEIGGRLSVRVVPGLGTEIGLTVPASAAYLRKSLLRLQRRTERA